MKVSVEADLLKTLPCVGKILSMVFMLEIGRVDRFPTAAHLASYAGLVPRVHSSGGHTRMGQVCGNVNRNLKWAFVETGNLIVISQRLRLAMQDGGFNMLAGEIEVDETFIGAKARNMHKAKRAEKIQGRGPDGKEIVFGMVERGGKVVVDHVETRRKSELQSLIRERVEAGAAIFSDELLSYDGLDTDYRHAVINHAVEYVNGNVHTNTMENFWSLLKRGLHGTYISVEPFHLFRYIDEQAFRYNNRKMTDAERFDIGVRQIMGKRLTYAELTGKSSETEIIN